MQKELKEEAMQKEFDYGLDRVYPRDRSGQAP